MTVRFAAACAMLGVAASAGPAHAQEGYPFPSCIASVVVGPGTHFARFVPPEVKGAAVRQVRGVVARSLTWRSGQTIKVCFKSGTQKAQERVARVAREWMEHANVVFDFEEGGAPRTCKGDGGEDIKIDFADSKGWWSFFGSLSRQRDPSMNLQFFGVDTPLLANGQPAPEAGIRKTILHEFGHALGMLHEHQSPSASCDSEINWEVAYALGKRMGWDEQKVNHNFRQLAHTEEFNLTDVDRKSIMHYSLPPEIFRQGKSSRCWVADNLELSEQDRRFIAGTYPKGERPLVVSGAPTATGPAATRSAKAPAGDDREALVRSYEEALKKAGVAAAKAAQLSKEFRKTAFGQ